MSNLVQIPWQPSYFLTPDTLTMLQLASAHAGHNVQVDDAWRSYASQKYLYDGWKAGLPGFNTASNPDTGQRNHMRGAAVDIVNRADRQFMLAVGFTPDADEWWHFNNPRWQSMPIIPTNNSTTTSSTASSAVKPIQEDDDMAKLYQITSAPAPSTSIYFVHPGGVSPVHSVDPEVIVLRSFADQMNAGTPPVLTDAQYKLVDQVIQRRL